MSMFYMVEASGVLNRNGKLAKGLTSYSEPEHMDRAAINAWLADNFQDCITDEEVILDKSYCKDVQVLDKYDQYGSRTYTLLVKAKGYNQADELARKFGDTLAPDYYRKQEEQKTYQKRVNDFWEEGRKLFGDGAKFTMGKRKAV